MMTTNDGTATPDWLFGILNEQVRDLTGHEILLDAAACDWNAKCADYLTEEQDSLTRDWSAWPTIWCNPPFSADLAGRFTIKAVEEAEKGSTVVLLLPSWPGYDWFQTAKSRGRTQDIIGPVAFRHHDGRSVLFNNGARGTSLVVITLGPHVAPGTVGPPIRRNGADTDRPDAVPPAVPMTLAPARRIPRWRSLAEIEAKPTRWLWRDRIPAGELTVLDGDPGSNKSGVLLDLAARISTGREMPDRSPGVGGGVVLLPGEDSIAKTVRRRLEAADADLRRIAVLHTATSLPRDLRYVEEAIRDIDARLVVIDPLMAFLTADASGDQRVRQALTPLRELAERTDAAIVAVRHLVKRGGKHAIYRGSGSIGVIGAARSGLLIGRPPDDPDLRVLAQSKSNLGPLAPSLLFEPVDADGVPQIQWRGECDWAADDLLGPVKQDGRRLTEAITFLTEVLERGPVEQQEVRRRVLASGLGYRTVERAKEVLGVVSSRTGFGPGSRCTWALPQPTEADA